MATYVDDGPALDVLRQDENGVDLEQIEYNLSLTPEQRIRQNEQFQAFLEAIKKARVAYYGFDPAVNPPTE